MHFGPTYGVGTSYGEHYQCMLKLTMGTLVQVHRDTR